MKISVIVSTYNSEAWLEKVLLGYAAQTWREFEVIVADDGSRDETRTRIESLRGRLPMPVRHLWQADQGFRKCEAMNMALQAAGSEYLIFTDGDCIPRRDFVDAHLRLREPGRFLSGGYHKLPMETSLAIATDDIRTGRCFDTNWLREHGMPPSYRDIKLSAPASLRQLFDALSPTRPSWNGHNASGWKRDMLAINGFDERMRYGGEDREFGERLENAGIRGRQIRYRAVCVHLDHSRGYKTPESLQANLAIRAQTRANRATWTPYGIDKTPC